MDDSLSGEPVEVPPSMEKSDDDHSVSRFGPYMPRYKPDIDSQDVSELRPPRCHLSPAPYRPADDCPAHCPAAFREPNVDTTGVGRSVAWCRYATVPAIGAAMRVIATTAEATLTAGVIRSAGSAYPSRSASSGEVWSVAAARSNTF